MVYLGADACIVGRNVQRTERMAKDIATARPGSKVIGFGAVDVRSYDSLKDAVDRCVKELGGIDFVMYVKFPPSPSLLSLLFFYLFLALDFSVWLRVGHLA
jgi:NAD(P)-dependent dehydrogenase (short-subunit alcohol dehydrogenase family)